MAVHTEWRVRGFDPRRVAELSRAAGVHPLLAQLLANRGVSTAAEARVFLDVRRDGLHDPALLPGVVEAADRLIRAIRQDRKIVIYGDYDVDGVCGTSLLWACLKLAGAKRLDYYIPHRIEEGYGLNAEALESLASEQGAELVVTVDCGVSACAEAELARSLGIELIVTDHHTPGPDWPAAAVVVHPRAGAGYPFHDLCGAGVAFKLAWQVCKSFGDGKRASPHLRDFLVRSIHLVALATVADVMPVENENRIFVKHGLASMTADPSVGLRALLEVSGVSGRKSLTTGTIGFTLAPRLNAAGRMDRARTAVELLTTEDPERALELARLIEACNQNRQETERRIVQEARELVEAAGGLDDRASIVVGRAGWHAGVIGIVASRLVDIYHRPSIVLTEGAEVAQGSGRSVPGFDLYAALAACGSHLVTFGGHKAAAGLKIERGRVAGFAESFDAYCRATLTNEQRRKVLWIDAEVPLSVLSARLVRAIGGLEPYGVGNPRPVLMAGPVRLAGAPRAVGQDGAHLQMRFAQGDLVMKGIGFNLAERLGNLPAGAECRVVFEPSMNTWRDHDEVQLEVKDVRVIDEETGERHGEAIAAGEGKA